MELNREFLKEEMNTVKNILKCVHYLGLQLDSVVMPY